MNLLIYLAVALFIATDTIFTKKYSKETNEVDDGLDLKNVKFRMKKYNEVWSKAVKKLSASKLKSLHKTLYKLDKAELEVKHQKGSGKPYDGELEAATRDRFLHVMQEYGLANLSIHYAHADHKKHTFEDSRLEKLWQRAIHRSDFSVEELNTMRAEFNHIQDRVVEYKQLHDIIKENDGNETKDEARKTHKELKQIRRELKDKFHIVKEKLEDHEGEISRRQRSDVEGDDLARFTDRRVVELWQHALTEGKFSDDELASIREELTHFQVRIDKHLHWRTASERLDIAIGTGDTSQKDEHEELQKKTREHGRIVKKYHASMVDRIKKEL